MKICDLYPEDINAMQISFVALRAGWDGLWGGVQSHPRLRRGSGAVAELRFKRETCGCCWHYRNSAEREQIQTSPATVRRSVSPTRAPLGAGLARVMVSPCLFFSFTSPAQIPGGGDGAG